MRYVQIVAGLVVNATDFDGAKPDEWNADQLWLSADDAQIGWSYDGSEFAPPVGVSTGAQSAGNNAMALEHRRRADAKDEIAKLVEKGDLKSVATALKKALELI